MQAFYTRMRAVRSITDAISLSIPSAGTRLDQAPSPLNTPEGDQTRDNDGQVQRPIQLLN